MATLDYAFLADYAHVEGGKLSSLGASYTHAQVNRDGGLWITSVAGRVVMTVGENPVELGIRVVSASGLLEIEGSDTLSIGPDAKPYGAGKVGVLFASTMAMPVVAEGLYEVFVTLDGQEARRLAFEISYQS